MNGRRKVALGIMATMVAVSLAACSGGQSEPSGDVVIPTVDASGTSPLVSSSSPAPQPSAPASVLKEALPMSVSEYDKVYEVNVPAGGLFLIPFPKGMTSEKQAVKWLFTVNAEPGLEPGAELEGKREKVAVPDGLGNVPGVVWTAGPTKGVTNVTWAATNPDTKKRTTAAVIVHIT